MQRDIVIDFRMPEPLIRAGGILKQAAAKVNAEV
jgi:fumarate hydratase class II